MSDTTEDARRNEAASTVGSFEFKGETFTVPLEYADYSLDFIEAVADGRPLAVQARELLGPEQWERVRALRLSGRDLEELYAGIKSAEGVALGNSEPSSD